MPAVGVESTRGSPLTRFWDRHTVHVRHIRLDLRRFYLIFCRFNHNEHMFIQSNCIFCCNRISHTVCIFSGARLNWDICPDSHEHRRTDQHFGIPIRLTNSRIRSSSSLNPRPRWSYALDNSWTRPARSELLMTWVPCLFPSLCQRTLLLLAGNRLFHFHCQCLCQNRFSRSYPERGGACILLIISVSSI